MTHGRMTGRALGRGVAVLIAIATVAGSLVAACGSGSDADGNDGSGASNSGSGANSGVGGDIFSAAGGNGAGTGGLEECAGESHVGDLTPVDVVIMFDQSGSMSSDVGGQTIWQLVTSALTEFVQSPESDGLGVGLQYFPLPDGPCDSCSGCLSPNLQLTDSTTMKCCCSAPTGQSCSLADGTACPTGGVCFQSQCYSGGANATCTTAAYAALEVPVELLPMNSAPIVSSLASHSPAGLTPTAPALNGAIEAAKARAAAFPDHTVAVVFATDGVPTECDPQAIDQIAAAAAAAAAGSPPIRTFVIGIGDVAALNAIAAAGGTTNAFLVSSNGNAGQQFIDALNEIQGSLLSCEFDIPVPAMGQLDYDLVNVEFTPSGGTPQILPRVADASACGSGGGWYYDNPFAPTKILLCPASCDLVTTANEATIEIVLGCQTVVN